MRTLIPDPPPAEFEALLELRRRLGADRSDEVWEGVVHLMPPPRGRHGDVLQQLGELLGPAARHVGLYPVLGDFGIGEPNDYRVPDGGLRRERFDAVYYPTAALAVEIVSPGDETWDKLPFYASHGVDELLIVDPGKRTVDWLALREDRYDPVERSGLIDLGAADLRERIDWPPIEEGAEPEQQEARREPGVSSAPRRTPSSPA
jgi:Uma2 family endonuclease